MRETVRDILTAGRLMTSAKQSTEKSPALKALAACVRRVPPEELRGYVLAAVEAGEDLCLLAAQHRLFSLLSIRIREAGLQSILPEEQWNGLSDEHTALAYHQAHMFAGALEALAALQVAGVAPVLPIKGLALAALIWPELLPRRLVDLDFLLEAHQIPRAQMALCTAGFVPVTERDAPHLLHFHAPRLGRAGVRVELHHRLWQPGRLPFGAPDIDGLAARSVSGRIQDEPIQAPCPEDAVILVAAVVARDRFDVPLSQWTDLYWLLKRSDSDLSAERLRSLARALRMRGLMSLVLRFTEELFEDDLLPDEEWDSVCSNAYEQLRPVFWRRLVAGSRLAEHHAVPFDWMASHGHSRARRRDGLSRGEAACGALDESPGLWSRLRSFGGPFRSAVKAGGYAGRLLTSRPWRQELREEIVIRRVLGALDEAEWAEAGGR